MAQARRDADRVLASLDWTKRDVVLTVPGTGDRRILPEQWDGLNATWPRGGVALGFVDYDTNIDFARSIPQGMATLRLVLAGIAARPGPRRVFLYGQSQGALIIGEAMSEPAVRAMVTRAAIFGHPKIAITDYRSRSDPKVRHHTNPDDVLDQTFAGSPREALEALQGVLQGDLLGAMPGALVQLARNFPYALGFAIWAARGQLHIPDSIMHDGHSYAGRYDEALAFIRDGAGPTSDARMGIRLIGRAARAAMLRAAEQPYASPYVRG